MRNIALLLLIPCMALATGCARDDDTLSSRTEPAEVSSTTDADNTARNADNTARNDETPEGLARTDTPMDQGNSEEDIRISSSIRKSIVGDKSLSTNAHNVKIITETGNVTLRGPVKSAQEKSKIEAYAKMATGVGRVDNMLEVETNP